MTSHPFVLSIEIRPGVSYQHPYHLGTDERLARQMTEQAYHSRIMWETPTVSVALLRDGQRIGTYSGRWSA